ncbi:MAG: LCP family protein [Chloroflexota bacterium]
MKDRPPERKLPPTPHWASPIPQPEDPDPSLERRGRTRERIRRRQAEKELPTFNWTWLVVALAVIGVIGVIALIALSTTHQQPGNSATATPPPTVSGTNSAVALPVNIHAWDGKQRFSILIMGIDKRPGETGTGFRTDTLILVSIDSITKKVGMLSIPRDLYMPLPNQTDMQPINTVYVMGELQKPGGGPALVMQAIQYNLGIPVNSYVVVSFDTVIGLVDAIGGIDINVPQAIDDPEYPDMYYGFDPLYIPPGLNHMDGKLALKFARTRHQGSDYDRANRQQQVVLAIRQKALTPDELPQLAVKAPDIWNQISKGVITDMSFDQLLSLGWYAKDIPAANIQRGTIDEKYVQAVPYNNTVAIVPNRSTIGQLMTQVFGADYNH